MAATALATTTPAQEERRAKAKLRAIDRAQRVRSRRHAEQTSGRWRELMAFKREQGCRCHIEAGMTFRELVDANLAGRAPERRNCAAPHFICGVLTRALDLTRRSS